LSLNLQLAGQRTLAGAVSGAVAAAVWAAQQPLDKQVFASRYDDVEMVGRGLTRGEHWYSAGLGGHLFGGAIFGAVYAKLAPALPIPAVLKGPAMAAAEHLALWPLTRVVDSWHPARADLPILHGNTRALVQGLWRHVLFGFVLGELERRLVASRTDRPVEEPDYASNGHGRIERAFSLKCAF
jgi:hypothetical protein